MILIINCGSSKSPFILDHVERHQKAEMITLDQFNFESISNYSGIVISGAPILVTEIDIQPYLNLFQFLLTYEKPVLGICFGHQMLGMIHGATASKCCEDRSWQEISKVKSHFIMNQLGEAFQMMEDHCECISVPKEFELVASSKICENEMMVHRSKPFVGVQFHPEVAEDNGIIFFDNFFNNFF